MTDKQTSHERTDGRTTNKRLWALLAIAVLTLLAGCGTTTQYDQTQGPEYIEMESTSHLQPGDTYNLTVNHIYQEDGRNVSENVTTAATITSENTSAITIQNGHMLVANSTANISDRVMITAEYENKQTSVQVAVAQTNVENLEELTPIWRFVALFSDVTIQSILVALFAGVAAARIATAFAGLGAIEMVLLAAWFAGWVPLGIALAGLFVAMFIGLNLAANIDYTVRR